MSSIDFVQAKDTPLVSNWSTVLTVPFVSTNKDQSVRMDVFLLVHWESFGLDAGLGLQFRLLRDGNPVYTGEPVIFNYLNSATVENQRLFNFFYVDRPSSGAYTYQLQAQVTFQSYIRYDVKVVEASMAVQVVDNISSSSSSPVYVSYEDQNGDGFVKAFETAKNTIIGTIPVGRSPGSICISPDGAMVYVVNQADNTLSLIDTPSNTLHSTLPVGLNPKAVMVTPDNRKTYVANYDDQTITIIDNATHTVHKTVSTGGGSPFALVACPNSWFMYAACKVGGTNDYVVAIDVSTDDVNQFAQGGWELTFDTDHNPLVVKPDGHMVAILGPHNHLRRVNGPNSFGQGNAVDWLNQTVSGIYLNNGYFFATRDFEEATLRTAFELAINTDGGVTGTHLPDTDSRTGQNKIQAAPDHSRVCISITASDNQNSGLQIIDFINQQGELLVQTHFVQIDSHIVEFSAANNIAITADSTKAYVTQHEYVYPVDLILFTGGSAIHMGDYTQVRDVVSAYRSRS